MGSFIPFVSRVVILDTALHVLELVQNSEHVDEFAQGEQVSLGHKVFPALSVTQALYLTAKALNCLTLDQGNISVTILTHKKPHTPSCTTILQDSRTKMKQVLKQITANIIPFIPGST